MAEEKKQSVTVYSYRKVWFVEKKIYAFQNIVLPFRYGMLPYVTVKYLMKVKLDGKNPVKYFCGYLRFLFTRKECIERFRTCRDHGVTVRINWNCGRRLE